MSQETTPHRFRIAPLLAFVLLLTSLAIPAVPAAAAPAETFADDFESDDFSGNTGSLPWSGPWVEVGESDGVGAGVIQIDNEPNCEDNICLVLGKDNTPDASVERGADLAVFTSAILEFDYEVHRHAGGSGQAELAVSTNGGIDWVPLDAWPLGTEVAGAAAYPVPTPLSADTRIRFSVTASTDDSHLNIDNVVVTAKVNSAPTFDQDLPDRSDRAGVPVNIASPASDPDIGDNLAYSATGLPEGISVDPTTGSIGGALGPNSIGIHAISITVTDDGIPNLQATDTFTWIVTAGPVTYLVANTGGANGGDDLLTAVDRTNGDPATNEINIGLGTTTSNIQAAALQPGTNVLFAVDGDQLGTIDVTTGVFTPRPSIAGAGNGSAGLIAFNDIEGLAFDPFSGDLYATHYRNLFNEDLLFRLDPNTGAHVSGAFGGDDYVVIQRQDPYWHAADIAFDPSDGGLYVVHWTLSALWSLATLDRETGDTLTIGPAPANLVSLAFDDTGRLFSSTNSFGLETLYELDKTNASQLSSIVIDNAENYGALAIPLSAVSNGGPVFDQDLMDRTDAEGSVISMSAAATDPDIGDTLGYNATGLPPGLDIDPDTGLITGTISFASAGTYATEITVRDDGVPNLDATDTFTWTVSELNQAPTFNQDITDRIDAEGTVVSVSAAATDPDIGDLLTYGATGLPPGLTIDTGSGLIAGTIDFDASIASPYAVTVTVIDNGTPNLSATPDTFVWTVGNTNRPPILASPGPQTTPELLFFSILVTATDPDGTMPAIGDGGTLPAWAVLTDNGDGTATITGTPGIGDSGTTTVTLTASDGSLTDDVVFDLTVINVNQPPTITNPGDQTHPEGAPFSLVLSGSDPDGTTISFVDSGTLPGWATLTDNGDNTATITGSPGYGDAATDTVTITVSDGSLTADAIFDITVTNINRPPTVDPIPDASVAEAAALTPIVATASDPDGTIPSLAATGLPGWATFTDNGDGTGTITGTPGYDDTGVTTVTINVEDGGTPNLAGFRTFDLTVTNTNRPPTVDPIPDASVAEAAALTPIVATASDPDGTIPSLAATGLPGWATFTDNGDGTGTITGTPGYDDTGVTTVTINVEDGGTPNLAGFRTFDLTVTNTNRPPVVAAVADQAAAEASPIVPIIVTGSDPDGTIPSLAATGLPGWATFTDNGDGTGTITGTPGYGDAAVTTISVVASDGVLTGSATFVLTVTDLNRAPIFDGNLQDRTDAEGAAVSFAPAASDPDGDTLSYAATGLPTGLTIDAESGLISGMIGYDAAGSHLVQVTVTDDGTPPVGAADSFLWTVTETNRAPVLEPIGDVLGAEETTISFTATAIDPDDDAVTFSIAGAPAGATIDPISGVFAWTPGEIHGVGSYPLTVAATDEGTPARASSVVVTITVTEVNRPPTIDAIGDQHNVEGDSVSLPIETADPDIPANTLAYEAHGLPSGLTINATTGLIAGTVSMTAAGVHPVTIVASDDGEPRGSTSKTFTWVVGDLNRPPVLDPIGSLTGAERTLITVSIGAGDPDDNNLTYSISGAPAGADIDAASGEFSWTPTETQGPGTYSFTVLVRDDGIPQLGDARTMTVTVTEANLAPTIEPISDRVDDEGDTVSLQVVASDDDYPANTLRFSAEGLPRGIVIDEETGALSGVIDIVEEAIAHHEVKITVTDDGFPIRSATTGFTWTLIASGTAPTNFPPSLDPVADQYTDVGAIIGLMLRANDTDPIVYSATGLPPGLRINSATGLVEGVVDATGVGTHGVKVTVTDNADPPLGTTIEFSWTVTDPVAADQKVDLIVSLSDDFDPRDEPAEPATADTPVRRGLVVMSSAAAATTESMQLPLTLLLALMAGFATIGRIGLYPILWRGDKHTGTITFYDEELGFGLVDPDDGGEAIFVHAHAFPRRQRATLRTGMRIRFRLLASDNRASAWGATTEADHA